MSESNKGKKIPIVVKNEWTKTNYICHNCHNGGLYKHNYFLPSKNPISFLYKCNKCGNVEVRLKENSDDN